MTDRQRDRLTDTKRHRVPDRTGQDILLHLVRNGERQLSAFDNSGCSCCGPSADMTSSIYGHELGQNVGRVGFGRVGSGLTFSLLAG